MNIEAIYHSPLGAYAYTNSLDTMRVRLRTSSQDTHIKCLVHWRDRCSSADCREHKIPMTWLANDGPFTYWEAELHETNRRLRYYFEIREGAETLWYTEDGYSSISSSAKSWLSGLFNWPYLYESQRIDVPAWVREVVLVVLNNSEESHYIEVPLQIAERSEKACWAHGTVVKDELSGRVYRVEKGMVMMELGAYEGAVISKFN